MPTADARLHRARALVRTLWRAPFFRFLVVGGVNTLFHLAVFRALLALSVDDRIAIALAWVAGIAFNFKTTGAIVFRSGGLRRAIPFVLVYVAIWALNVVLFRTLVEAGLPKMVAQAVVLVGVVPLSYVSLKRLVFDR